MKKLFVSLLLIFLSTIVLHAQGSADQKSKATPVITKGYHSIYKNAEKLNLSDPLLSVQNTNNSTANVQPEKGYYSMSNHHRRIYKSGVSFIARTPKRPTASKGYYNMNWAPASEEVKRQQMDSLLVIAEK